MVFTLYDKSGYIGISYDITDFLYSTKKTSSVVRVDASQYEGWFYEGAGIYRHVCENTFDETDLAEDGVFAHATLDGKNATLTVKRKWPMRATPHPV